MFSFLKLNVDYLSGEHIREGDAPAKPRLDLMRFAAFGSAGASLGSHAICGVRFGRSLTLPLGSRGLIHVQELVRVQDCVTEIDERGESDFFWLFRVLCFFSRLDI